MEQNILKRLKDSRMTLPIILFAVITLIMIVIGIAVLKVPAVAMCILIILEAGLAVMLHHVELWLHGVLVLAEIIAGILAGKVILIILCVVVYVAATIFLQMLDKGDNEDGR